MKTKRQLPAPIRDGTPRASGAQGRADLSGGDQMSTDLIRRLLTALKTCSESAYSENLPGSGWSQWVHFDREKVAKAITEADAHLAMPDTPGMALAATLTISPFKGYENTEFQYHGNLPAGTYALYAAAQEGK